MSSVWTDPPNLAVGDFFDEPTYELMAADLRHVKGEVVWTPVAYSANWSDFDAANRPTKYRKMADFVIIRGACKPAAGAPITMFTLPVGYRPATTIEQVVNNNGAFGTVTVNPGGAAFVSAIPAVGGGVILGTFMVPLT